MSIGGCRSACRVERLTETTDNVVLGAWRGGSAPIDKDRRRWGGSGRSPGPGVWEWHSLNTNFRVWGLWHSVNTGCVVMGVYCVAGCVAGGRFGAREIRAGIPTLGLGGTHTREDSGVTRPKVWVAERGHSVNYGLHGDKPGPFPKRITPRTPEADGWYVVTRPHKRHI